MLQRELPPKTWVFEKTFHLKCVLKIPTLFNEFGRFTFEPTRVRDYHEPWVKHEPTSSQALICYFLLFLSFMATEKQFQRGNSEGFPDKYNTLRLGYSYIWVLGCKMLPVSYHSKSIFKVWCWDGTRYGWNSWGKLTDMRYRITEKPHYCTEGAIESVPVFWHAVSVLGYTASSRPSFLTATRGERKGEIKIMQINVKKGGKIGAPPSFLVLAFYLVSKEN